LCDAGVCKNQLRIGFNLLIYDYDGSSDHFGEEIQAKVVISPVENEVKDMRIDILEADALIDDNSFEYAIFSPTGADISVTRGGHTYFCERLRKDESITLMFNAYPETISKREIKVADVRVSYTQLGQRLEDWGEVKANLEKSVWFRYEDAKKRASSTNWLFYVGLILAIVAGVSLFIQWFGRGKREKEKDEISQNWRKNLEDISKKLDLAKRIILLKWNP